MKGQNLLVLWSNSVWISYKDMLSCHEFVEGTINLFTAKNHNELSQDMSFIWFTQLKKEPANIYLHAVPPHGQ